MKKLFIRNTNNFHYEIIESVIVKYYRILNIDKNIPIQIYLQLSEHPDNSFKSYIKSKYPKIIFKQISNFDYYINCTVYDKDYKNMDKQKSVKKYISHEITNQLKSNPNVYFLTPLGKHNLLTADILPFSNMKKSSNIPIYIIQGNLNDNRRNLSLLAKILDKTYDKDFIIKLVGRGYLPPSLLPYKNKIILKNNLNFQDYHKQFLDAYCILPLITKQSHPQYYQNKLTSSINYAKGYNLKCLIDKDLQNIYKLNNVAVFNNIDDIQNIFEDTLKDFYK